ncbi:MAG: type I methionyl aminopeptidase [Candidatus Nanopelagicales bacterium]
MRLGRRKPEIKTAEQLAAMREAGLVVAAALRATTEAVAPGVTTAQLDRFAEQVIKDAGAAPSFYGYYGFPAHICVSVNDEVVHGIPGARVLRDGDLVSIDCGAIVRGWHGDAAVSVFAGEPPSVAAAKLSEATRESLWAGLAAAQAGATIGDVGFAVQNAVAAAGERDGVAYGIVDGYTGHGIGSAMHMDPNVPNVGRPGRGQALRIGMAIAVEPMVTLARPGSSGRDSRELDDGWTVVTADGGLAAHWEHTVAVTAAGPWVLTAESGGGLLSGDPLA